MSKHYPIIVMIVGLALAVLTSLAAYGTACDPAAAIWFLIFLVVALFLVQFLLLQKLSFLEDDIEKLQRQLTEQGKWTPDNICQCLDKLKEVNTKLDILAEKAGISSEKINMIADEVNIQKRIHGIE